MENPSWVIESELSRLIGSLKASSKTNEVESLIQKLAGFKRDFSRMSLEEEEKKRPPQMFLNPFLEVVRTDPVTAPVTGLALDSINKFLAYGYISEESIHTLEAQDLAITVAHAKFVGVDQGTDEVVLMKVLKVLRSLMLCPVGKLLTDESVCEVLHSTFRICMEGLLSELLRKMAEASLVDMIRVLFGRLGSLSDRPEGFLPSLKRLKMMGSSSTSGGSGRGYTRTGVKRSRNSHRPKTNAVVKSDSETLMEKKDLASAAGGCLTAPSDLDSELRSNEEVSAKSDVPKEEAQEEEEEEQGAKEFVNQQGITFMATNAEIVDESGSLIAYGIPCVRELFRFLISLINPYESNSGPAMIEVALSLLSTALEIGGKDIDKFESLLNLVKDDLSKNVSRLLSSESRAVFSSNLRISFLLFSLFRRHLKFQLELFFVKLMDVITSESLKVTYEQKETALDLVVRLYRLPGFITQIYLNYDCDIYTSNIFEDLTKMLSKNTFPLMGLHSTHFLSLEALLAVVESIERHCVKRMLSVKKKGGVTEESSSTLTHEQLMALKHKKKLISTATEQFNNKPSKGIAFMQESGLLIGPTLDPVEVATFLRENPHLDKKQLGDYISNRKNLHILGAFVKSFDFQHLRIDEALRLFLETFRLPGEAPLITLIMEHFADHWQVSNGDPLSSSDSAFTLAYAVIMLNVDQHNVNHTKKNDPMTLEQFCRNLRGTNGGSDHNEDMLAEVYHNIRTNEIVMPAEQSGVVKENYLWKCVLKRSLESDFLESPNGTFDHELFGIIWGPTIAALSYVFDKAPPGPMDKSLGGFQKCATIADHYSMADVFDQLIISLCKYTTLLSVEQLNRNSPFLVAYGSNEKALAATRLFVSLVVRHGDILREGWKNVTESLLQLFRAGLLPESLTRSEDYLDPKGVDLLNKEGDDKGSKVVESGFLNSFVSFISMASEQRVRSPEEEEFVQLAIKTVSSCNIESILTESKFLLEESLSELIRCLIKGSNVFLAPPPPPSTPTSSSEDGSAISPEDPYDEKALLFLNELLVRITIENRDRVQFIWSKVVEHLTRQLSEAGQRRRTFLLERVVTNILRLCVRLARKEDLVSLVLVSGLKLLLSLPHSSSIARITSYGLYELLRNNAANIHESCDWAIVFDLMDVVGAGVCIQRSLEEEESPSSKDEEDDWIVLGENNVIGSASPPLKGGFGKKVKSISVHDAPSFLKCCESVSFLVRDVAHITPHNFEACVVTLRLFVEAAYFGIRSEQQHGSPSLLARGGPIKKAAPAPIRRIKSAPNNFTEANYDADESDNEDSSAASGDVRDGGEYHHVSLRLLDLMHTLHSRAGSVYEAWGMKLDLWGIVWCPLLQGMGRLCSDHRPQIRTAALTALQRSLLHTDLRKGMSSKEWEAAFTSVLFPMLSRLLKLQANSPGERNALEETRTRAATLLGKVFLQHLSPLTELPTFSALWLTILDFMEKFIKSASTDVLGDAIPESLKNMLLVMDTAGTFRDGGESCAPLWDTTWDKLSLFLPELMTELFGSKERKQTKDEGIDMDQKKPPPVEPVASPEAAALSIEGENNDSLSLVEKGLSPSLEGGAIQREEKGSLEDHPSSSSPLDAGEKLPCEAAVESEIITAPHSLEEKEEGSCNDGVVSSSNEAALSDTNVELTVEGAAPLLSRSISSLEAPPFVVKSDGPTVSSSLEAPSLVVKSEGPTVVSSSLEGPLVVKSEGPTVVSSSLEAPSLVVKSEEPTVVSSSLEGPLVIKSDGPTVSSSLEGPLVMKSDGPTVVSSSLEAPSSVVKSEGPTVVSSSLEVVVEGAVTNPPSSREKRDSVSISMDLFPPTPVIPLDSSLGIIPPPPVLSISQPPPGILASLATGFTPIHAAEPPGGPRVPLVNPKALLPNAPEAPVYNGENLPPHSQPSSIVLIHDDAPQQKEAGAEEKS